MCNDPKKFQEDVEFLEGHRAEYTREHPDKVVLIKNGRQHGFYESELDAYFKGVALFGADDFIIETLSDVKPVAAPVILQS